MFAGFGDFAFYEVKLKGAHLVAGFGRICRFETGSTAHRSDWCRRARGRRARGDRAHERRSCETCRLYATKLRDAPDGDWRCVGCDPEGLDLQCERLGLRLPFPQRVTQPGVLRAVLKQMAEQARAA
jgi:hypothetical protein